MLIRGDARSLPLADGTVQCVVTSPPYWGLRDYGIAGQLGLEPTPDEYVADLVAVFREVRRCLKPDGVVFLVLGDSYASQGGPEPAQTKWLVEGASDGQNGGRSRTPGGLKPKDLVGIPWRVAFALQADGWWLRSEIIWAKAHEFCAGGVGSAMPESCKDRPTRAHETVFMLAKSARYFYDGEAVKQAGVWPTGTRAAKGSGTREGNRRGGSPKQDGTGNRRTEGFNARYFNAEDEGYAVYSGKCQLRDVWFVSPKGYPEAHFATYPENLVEPCIRAGSRPGDLVLDPFCGSGTTGVVAHRLSRRFVGCDLNPAYLALAQKRMRGVQRELVEAG